MEQLNISELDYQMAKFLKAIGNPIRLSIIRKLIEKSHCSHCGDLCKCEGECERATCKCGCKCGELVELFPMSQSTISQHIKELKDIGLIEKDGRKGDFTLNRKKLREGLISLLAITGYNDKEESLIKGCQCC